MLLSNITRTCIHEARAAPRKVCDQARVLEFQVPELGSWANLSMSGRM